jgi:tRNA threonylcarbamoyladenosine modification (KEOPS) complex  Pcc1 subunit
MKYKCSFTVESDDGLYNALLPDVSSNKRASLKIEQKKDELFITIKALDAIALKAFVSSVIKLLEVSGKVEKV